MKFGPMFGATHLKKTLQEIKVQRFNNSAKANFHILYLMLCYKKVTCTHSILIVVNVDFNFSISVENVKMLKGHPDSLLNTYTATLLFGCAKAPSVNLFCFETENKHGRW